VNNHTNMDCCEVLEVIRIICFEYLAEIADIGSDLFWLITTAGYIQKENYKGKIAICVVASILWVVNVFRFIHTALGRGILRAAIKRGDITKDVLLIRNMQYAARAYMFEELPNIIMVVYVAEQLREFSTAALTSIGISIVMLLVNLWYHTHKTLMSDEDHARNPDGVDVELKVVCYILICPCGFVTNAPCMWGVASQAGEAAPMEKAIEITGSVFI